MSNLTKFEAAALPAHIAKMFGDFQPNDALTAGVNASFPTLSYKGKTWHVVQGDNRQLITNSEGEPRMSIEVVILKANPHISKIYYEGGYVEGSSEKPSCYSHDGITPAVDAVVPQASKCATCPRNVWGSRITDMGAKGKECSDSRRLAVAPAGDLGNPMLLRVPAGSLKELVNYAELLNRRRVPYQALVTKVAFDTTVAHPKFIFTPLRFLEPNELNEVTNTLQLDVVDQVVGLTGRTADLPAETIAPQPTVVAKGPVAKVMVSESDVDNVITGAFAAPKQEAPAPRQAQAKDAFGGSAQAREPEPAPKSERQAVLLEEADNTLDALLETLKFDD
jgi:hypothetical protein